MFRLKRGVVRPVRWILIVVTIGLGCFAYTILSRPTKSSGSVTYPESTPIPNETSAESAASNATDELSVQELTIATWNINYANRDLAEVSRLLRESNADIVCLQETTEFSEVWLQRELAERYPHCFIAGHTGKFLAEGFMVLSRKPILDPRFVPPTRTFFGHIVFQTDHGGTRSTILTVHMTPFTARESRTIGELLSAVNQTEMDHQHEVQAILKDIPQGAPTLIVGDFNSPSHGIAPTTLKGQGLMDVFAELYPDADQTHKSWDFRFRNGLRATWRIDYVFHSRHYTARSGALLECRGSDHHLLVAVFDCDRTTAPLPFRIPQKIHH